MLEILFSITLLILMIINYKALHFQNQIIGEINLVKILLYIVNHHSLGILIF